MLQDNIILDVVKEVDIEIPNMYLDFAVIVDLDSIGQAPGLPGDTHYGIISRAFIFTKSVRGIVNNQPNTYYGSISQQITFTKAVSGIVNNQPNTYFGQILIQTIPYPLGEAKESTIIFGANVSGIVSSNTSYKETSVAEISLAPHGIPSERINHIIKIRARTTSGSTGVIKAALYEGTTLRSGAAPLVTSLLTNSLADYSLPISDVDAAEIIDYSNLSIKFWGYDSAGNALVFEIADIYLELPTSAENITYYGAVSQAITFTKAVSGVINNKKTAVAEVSLASHATPSERINHSINVRARTTSGSTGVIKAALYEGTTNRSGDLLTELLTNILTDYKLIILDSAAATITDYSNLSIKFWGYDSAGNALVFQIADIYLELPTT